jgi:uncharacterized protein YecT (DUF1311 family)
MNKILILFISAFISHESLSQTQGEMNTEAFKEYKKSDDEMAKMYKKVMSGMSNQNAKNLLLEAQRAWIKYKESHCKSLANQFEGGTMAPMVYYECLVEVTNERKEHLKRFLDN